MNFLNSELDGQNETLGKKIRNGELQKIPYLVILGDREMTAGQISVRERSKGDLGGMELSEFLKKVKIQ